MNLLGWNHYWEGIPETGKGNPMTADTAQKVTQAIISALEKGTVPWRKPWEVQADVSFSTHRPYRGINPFILSATRALKGYASPVWITYNQARKAGGSVRAGEKGTAVVFWKFLDVKDRAPDAEPAALKRIPLLRYYTVFNIDQTDGVELPKCLCVKREDSVPHLGQAEKILSEMHNPPAIQHGGDRACYSPSTDQIRMPAKEAFSSSEEYYSTLFHELSHSTGHASRLKRFPVETVLTPFGSPDYSFEELIAEMGACYVLSECGVFETVKENSAAYVDHWKKQIADDPGAFIRACGKGQKAADYILGEYQGEATGETEEHAVA